MASNIHHRLPRSKGGKDTPSNLVRVNANRHHHFHATFGVQDGTAIARELNEVWLPADGTMFYIRHKGRRLTKAQIEEVYRELRRILG